MSGTILSDRNTVLKKDKFLQIRLIMLMLMEDINKKFLMCLFKTLRASFCFVPHCCCVEEWDYTCTSFAGSLCTAPRLPRAKGLSSSIRGFNGLKLLSSNTPVIPKPTVQKLVIMAHTRNSSTQEAETPGFRIQTQPRHSKSCLKTDNIQQSKPSKSSIQREVLLRVK